jgi:hypothetical protein
MSRRRIILFIVGVCLCGLFSGPLSAAPAAKAAVAEGTPKTFTLKGFGDLTLSLPDGWEATIENPSDGTPPRVRLTTSSVKDFWMTIAPATPASDKEPVTVERAKKMLEDQMKGLGIEAKESSLKMEELNGRQAKGYWFALTRENKKAANLPHASHARVAMGDQVILAGTIVQRYKSGPAQHTGLEILRTATWKPAPKAAAATAPADKQGNQK